MALSIGIVGLPNVGKSTIFNAITKSKVDAQNYPFCTIEPNVGCVKVPDNRLDQLAKKNVSRETIYATVDFVDIAGLVKGASKGEGLGNKFLANIRESDAILHILRHFNVADVTHVEGRVSAKEDLDIIRLELIISDLERITSKISEVEKKVKAKAADKDTEAIYKALSKIKVVLENNQMANTAELTEDETELVKTYGLLTFKPELFALNVDQTQILKSKEELLKEANLDIDPDKVVVICASLESELADMSDEEAGEYLKELGIGEKGLNKLIRAAYYTLNYISYFTVGEKEARAWTITRGTLAPQAAGKIHGDFEKGFIRAEICPWDKMVELGWAGAKEKGLVRTEGKDYEFQDGDVVIIHHS